MKPQFIASVVLRGLLVLALASCGGGVGTGGTGGDASAYAAGPITGFGSVFVGGVRFDDSAAAVEDADGSSRTRDDLRLGMHLHAMCGAWLDHPFWRTKFILDDPADLDKLRASSVKEVWIDVSKGRDVEASANEGVAPRRDQGLRDFWTWSLSRTDCSVPSS